MTKWSALAGMCYRFSKKSPWYIITEFIKPRNISKTYVYSFIFWTVPRMNSPHWCSSLLPVSPPVLPHILVGLPSESQLQSSHFLSGTVLMPPYRKPSKVQVYQHICKVTSPVASPLLSPILPKFCCVKHWSHTEC